MLGRCRQFLGVVLLSACLAPAWGCNHPAEVRKLEGQKAALLASTRPKQDFWDQVGRKGEALKKARAAAALLASVQQQITATRSSLEQARGQLDAARETNAKAADVLSGQQDLLAQAQHQVAADRAELAGFQTRQRQRRNRGGS